LAKYSENFKRLEGLQILGKGGEAIVFNVDPYLPIEVIAKVPLGNENQSEQYSSLLLENHFLKLIANKDYIC
jgi:hypothetical protein